MNPRSTRHESRGGHTVSGGFVAGRLLTLLLGMALGPARHADALGPHEILLLANRNAPESVELARHYADLRHVPECNLVLLDLPEKPPLEITAKEFNQLIREPAGTYCRERGLDDHILAWTYSTHLPIRISGTPVLSLQGITFLKGRLPASDEAVKGAYASPLFAGPENPSAAGFPPQSLDVQKAWQGKDMPIPSMMLGFIGPNGNTREEIAACLERGTRSDGTRPDGLVCIVTNADVRSVCRQWEFGATARELATLEMAHVVTNALPPGRGLIGLMTGAAEVAEAAPGRIHFLPGAIADNLTSYGAAFDTGGQTKLSAWIRAGATAAAGTVVEPYSIWQKFPHSRIFTYPRSGCTLLESYFQALRWPLQILILGDPLASPWSPRSTLVLEGLEGGPLTGRRTIQAKLTIRDGETFSRTHFLLDGRTLQPPGREATAVVEAAGLKQGKHTLRAIAYGTGAVRAQVFTETVFEVP